MNSSRRAFTLVEILVVLAIVAVLCALLMSTFVRARGQGQKTACASNLRQLADAMHFYLQDNGGAFPLERSTKIGHGIAEPVEWSDRVGQTQPIAEIVHCPAFPKSARWSPTSPDYRLSRDVGASGSKGATPKIILESQFPRPATTELLTEIALLDNGVAQAGRYVASARCGEQLRPNSHLDGANIAYLDGHVKWMSAPAQGRRDEACERE